MAKVKQGIQLYTLRDYIQTADDFDETLAYLKSIGVSVVQISAIGPIPARIQADILEKYEMEVCVTHKNFNDMLTDLDKMIDEHDIIGCDCMGIGSMPNEYRENADTLRDFIKKADDIGRRMLARGKHFAYHNHNFEFEKIEGDKTRMDILLEETDPEVFWFIPDVAWMQVAGVDPAKFLGRMKGRVKVAHFKDYVLDEKGEVKFTTLGKGLVDIPACYRACRDLGIPYAVYEQDRDWENDDPKYCCELSYNEMLRIESLSADTE